MVSPCYVRLCTRVSHTRGSVAPFSHSPTPLMSVALRSVCAAASDARHEDFRRAQPLFQRCYRRCRRAAARLPTPRPTVPTSSDRRNRPAEERAREDGARTSPRSGGLAEGGRAHADRLSSDTCVAALEESNSPGPESALALGARMWTTESESVYMCVLPSRVLAVATTSSPSSCECERETKRERERVPRAVRGSELLGVVRGEGETASSSLVWP